MELAPAWMSYTKENSSSQGTRFLGKERERGPPKYGRQLSFSHVMPTYHHSSSSSFEPDRASNVPFACSVSSPPAPPHAHTPASILGEQPRVLNRSKSSPGFGSPKSKQKKSPDRTFSSFKAPKPKPPKPPLSPSSYMKSQSQPNLFNTDKINNWHQAHKAQQNISSPFASPSAVNSGNASAPNPPVSSTSTSSQPTVPPSTSPPLPPSSSPPPPVLVPEIDKLKTLIPATGPPPKSVRPRVMVAPPLPLAKKAPASPLPNNNNNSNITINNINLITNNANPNGNASNAAGSPNGLSAYFRKTNSEPSLMHHKASTSAQDAAIAFRRAEALAKKARALESEKAQAQLLKEAVASKQPKRSNFFQHVIKQEEQGISVLEDESPIGIDGAAEPYSPATSPPLPSSTPPLLTSSSSSSLTSSSSTTSSTSSLTSATSLASPSLTPPSGIRSPLPEDMEDEERFLRTLGWVPDEEDFVPALEEDEIRDVRVKIFLSRGAKAQEEGEEEEKEERATSVKIGVGVK